MRHQEIPGDMLERVIDNFNEGWQVSQKRGAWVKHFNYRY